MEPKLKTDERSRQMARRIRDRQWATLQHIAEHNPLHVCWWDKDGRHKREPLPADLLVLGLIDGTELAQWLRSHPDWTVVGEWSDERCAVPIHITDAGREALANRDRYDPEPVVYGMVEPGWQAVPLEQEPVQAPVHEPDA